MQRFFKEYTLFSLFIPADLELSNRLLLSLHSIIALSVYPSLKILDLRYHVHFCEQASAVWNFDQVYSALIDCMSSNWHEIRMHDTPHLKWIWEKFCSMYYGGMMALLSHGSSKWIIMHEKWRRLDSNGVQLKWRFGTHGNWKNQNPGGRFGATS